MGRQGDRQTGFSIVEAVVVLVVVGVIGTAGWFVYQHNRVKVTNAAAGTQTTTQGTNQNTNTTPTTTSNQTVVKVSELGIQITVPNDIKDLIYQVSTVTLRSGQTETLAKFSTQALTSADSDCSVSFGPLGSLGRVDGQYPSNDPNAAFNYGQLVQQFPTFFIISGSPNASCSSNPNATPSLGHFKGEFVAAQSTIQALN